MNREALCVVSVKVEKVEKTMGISLKNLQGYTTALATWLMTIGLIVVDKQSGLF
jgi:hypothetical protein